MQILLPGKIFTQIIMICYVTVALGTKLSYYSNVVWFYTEKLLASANFFDLVIGITGEKRAK